LSPNWLSMGDWIEVDISLVSSLSVARPGRYVVDENGIYLVTSTLYVSVTVPSGEERWVTVCNSLVNFL
jgi:hypothetical protein